MEDGVIEAFCNINGAKVVPETRMFASRKNPNCTANIDAIIRFDDGRMYVFEAKTTIRENWKAWADDRIPPQYVPQMRQYPAVLDDDRNLGTYIGCLFTNDKVAGGVYLGSEWDGKELVARYVERDKLLEEQQLEGEERWFGDYIIRDETLPRQIGCWGRVFTVLVYTRFYCFCGLQAHRRWRQHRCRTSTERAQ